MIENTLENKAKFFAQYWGQRVMQWDHEIELVGVVGGLFNVNPYLLKSHVFLKPLSSITDEDQNNILSSELSNNTNLTCEKKIGNFYDSDIYTTDYLRSKGYALPWMGLSVDDMVEFVWVKLIEQ